jgi:alpha-glucosidase (family GH31 glycosyl hydrolase)
MLDILTEYTTFSGRMSLLPDWVSDGAIVNLSGGKDKVKETLKKLRDLEVPVSAVLIHDWTGQRLQDAGRGMQYTRQWWNWESDNDLYPDWNEFVSKLLNEDGIRVLTYMNPLLSSPGLKPRYKKDLYTEANKYGYFIQHNDGQPLSVVFSHDLEAGIIDLTNSEARAWLKQVIKDQVWSADISGKYKIRKFILWILNLCVGMMVDFGEHVPYKEIALQSDNMVSNSYHNRYSEEWAQFIKETVSELGKEQDAVCFFRSGYTHSPGLMNLFSTGNQNITWDQNHGIKSAVSVLISPKKMVCFYLLFFCN